LAARLPRIHQHHRWPVLQDTGGEELAGHGRARSCAEKLEGTHRAFLLPAGHLLRKPQHLPATLRVA
jgi:hypothetical protein